MLKMKRKIRRRLAFGGLYLVKFSHVKQADRQCWYHKMQGLFPSWPDEKFGMGYLAAIHKVFK